MKALDLRGDRTGLVLAETYPCENIHHVPMAAERVERAPNTIEVCLQSRELP